MREIKFRGKTKYNGNHRFSGDWVYGFYYEKMDMHYIIDTTPDAHGNISYDHVLVDKDTVGQCIGLKDYDHNEIYLGDIIRDLESVDFYLVEWNERWGCFQLKRLTEYNDTSLEMDNLCNSYIETNIHKATLEQLKKWGIEK